MADYDRLAKDFFRKVDPSNPLHYYGYKHVVRDEDTEDKEGKCRRGKERKKERKDRIKKQ